MLQQQACCSQQPVVREGMKQKLFSQSDPSPGAGSTSSHSSFDIRSQLKSNTVIALSSLATNGEGKFYCVRCLIGGVWSLQMQAGLQPYDPAVQLVVVNQNGKLGLRSAIAEGRLLCCNRSYHLAFERWEMDCQEAWTLQGSSLSDCTLRNTMHKLTLNIRITVLAEPTDILGNTRITSALMTTSLSGLDSLTTSKSNSALSSYVKERLGQKGQKDSHESPRLFLVKPGSNNKSLNPFTHQRDRTTSQEEKTMSAVSSKTGGQGKAFLSSSENLHESNGASLPRGGVYTFSSSVKSDFPQYTPIRTQLFTEGSKADSNWLPNRSSATNWKQTTPSREEVQLSSFPATTRMFVRETQTDVRQEPNGNHVLNTGVHPSYPSSSEKPRKVRKWKRIREGNHKVSHVDLDGHIRPNCGLKKSQLPEDFDEVDEDGTCFSPGNNNRSSSPRDGGHSPQVVIKRQTGFLATKADFDVSPRTPQRNVKGNASENSGEKLREDTARQEKDKVIHWNLQAAVGLLKFETEQKLTMIAKTALEEANARTVEEDMMKNNRFSKDEFSEKRGGSWKRSLRPTTNISFHHNKRSWTYPLKGLAVSKEEDVSLAVSSMGRNSSSRLQMLLKLWFFLPVPLLALAYVTLIYRRRKANV